MVNRNSIHGGNSNHKYYNKYYNNIKELEENVDNIQQNKKNLIVDDFSILGKLGKGGDGLVLLALDQKASFGSTIFSNFKVIKYVDVGSSKTSMNNVKKIIKSINECEYVVNHGNPTASKDVKNAFYITMGRADKTLSNYLRKNNININDRIKLALNLIEGLYCLHKKNIVHGDIKVDNVVMIDGKAHFIDIKLYNQFTCTPQGYIPPEYSNKQENTKKSDIYCLGIVLSAIFLGIDTFRNLQKKILTTPPQNLNDCIKNGWIYKNMDFKNTLVKELEKQLNNNNNKIVSLIKEMLNDNPSERPECSELEENLRNLNSQSQQSSSKNNSQPSPSTNDESSIISQIINKIGNLVIKNSWRELGKKKFLLTVIFAFLIFLFTLPFLIKFFIEGFPHLSLTKWLGFIVAGIILIGITAYLSLRAENPRSRWDNFWAVLFVSYLIFLILFSFFWALPSNYENSAYILRRWGQEWNFSFFGKIMEINLPHYGNRIFFNEDGTGNIVFKDVKGSKLKFKKFEFDDFKNTLFVSEKFCPSWFIESLLRKKDANITLADAKEFTSRLNEFVKYYVGEKYEVKIITGKVLNKLQSSNKPSSFKDKFFWFGHIKSEGKKGYHNKDDYYINENGKVKKAKDNDKAKLLLEIKTEKN